MRNHINRWYKLYVFILLLLPIQSMAEGGPKKSAMDNPMVQVFVLIIAVLGLCIVLMAKVLLGAAQYKVRLYLEDKKKSETAAIIKTGLLVTGLMICSGLFAADAPQALSVVKDDIVAGMDATAFYVLLSVVIIELILLLGLLYNLKFLLRLEKIRKAIEEDTVKENKWLLYWDRFNSLRPIKEEASIDLGHDYDGIRELDNRLPPWWLYGFFACILFAVIYLWRFEVVHTGPSTLDEYNMAMQKGEEEKEEYLKTAASKVDENSVKLLTDESNLLSGKAIFTTVCAACHSADGGGLVGPNLTDKYWLHGGSVKDIFKTIKYGWQDKGMKSWKDDYTPVQIAQLASYVKSLAGKTPAKAKEPQGVLFEDTGNNIDSTKQRVDSLRPAISSINKTVPGS